MPDHPLLTPVPRVYGLGAGSAAPSKGWSPKKSRSMPPWLQQAGQRLQTVGVKPPQPNDGQICMQVVATSETNYKTIKKISMNIRV